MVGMSVEQELVGVCEMCMWLACAVSVRRG